MAERARIILENCKGNVLHVGCGSSGLHIKLAYELKNRLYGLDIMDYSQIYQRFTQGNAENMSFKSKSFETIILADVLMHVFDQKKVIKECFRILKNQGTLIVTVPNFESIWNKIFGTYNSRRKTFVRKWRINQPNKDFKTAYTYQFNTNVKSTKELLTKQDFIIKEIKITHLTDDVGGTISDKRGKNHQRGWLIDARYVLSKLIPEKYREQIVLIAKRGI